MSRVYSRLRGGGKSVLRRSGMPMGCGLKQHFLPLRRDPIRLEAPAVGLGGLREPVPQGRVAHQQRHDAWKVRRHPPAGRAGRSSHAPPFPPDRMGNRKIRPEAPPPKKRGASPRSGGSPPIFPGNVHSDPCWTAAADRVGPMPARPDGLVTVSSSATPESTFQQWRAKQIVTSPALCRVTGGG